MKSVLFIRFQIIPCVGLVIGFGGCATQPRSEPGAWGDPRPLGASLATYVPPRDVESETAPLVIDEPSGTLTLRQALALALARNPELAAFSWEVRVGEARLLQAGLRPNPAVGLEFENVLGTGDSRAAREAETTVQLSQLIELGGKRAARVRAASFERERAAWDYEVLRIGVFSLTAEAFVEVLSLQHRLVLAEDTVRLGRQVLEAVEKRVQAARTFAVEAIKAEVALASVEIERDQTRRALTVARHRLAASWGGVEPGFERVVGDLEQLSEVPALEQVRERVQQNPELARWATEIAQREAVLDLERSKRRPDLTVEGGYRRLSGPDDNAFLAGVSLPLPLFDKNEGNIKEAEYRLAQAQAERRAAEFRVAARLGQAWQQLAAARAEVSAVQEKILPGAKQTFDTVSQYYREGRLSFLEVLDAQRTLFTARAQYYRALGDYHRATVAIERLIGEPLSPAGP